ncbi:GNAT family N-acetyltransferase [Ornithinimicrobium cavernae]|uniref:GNAT family N-acetyltransferase n=1 Tax=Ornithinimicrobium cavernae TaxID=2666047 RepID=UPI000D69464A|nr:GNAT family N-acetyltransferase [Ornithinimicrobium cavernae]
MADRAQLSGAVVLRRCGPAEALENSGRLAEIYGLALGARAEPSEHFAATFRTCIQTYDGATVLAAVSGGGEGQIVGFLYGYDLQLQHWWPQEVAGPLRAAGHGGWLSDAFELVELQVHPAAQGRGVGTALLTRQLVEMPHRRALLTADPEGRARVLYRRLGFRDLVPDFAYAGTAHRAALMGWERATVPPAGRTGG